MPGTLVQQTLVQDSDTDPFNGPTGVIARSVSVAAEAPALIAEVLSTSSPDLDLYVGLDNNSDGALQANEVVCASASDAAIERCRVDAPNAGAWIVLVQNYTASTPGAADALRLSFAALTNQVLGNTTAQTPSSVQSWSPFALNIAWNFTPLTGDPPRYAYVALQSAGTTRAGFPLTIEASAQGSDLFANGFEGGVR